MDVQEIVTRVRSAIDELTANDSQFITQSEDEQNMTRIIVDKIDYALQHIIENAPLDKLDSDMIETLTQQEMEGFSIDQELIGRIKLPDDVLRIIKASLSSWRTNPVPEGDSSPVYLMQLDQYAKGSWDRPVSILTHRGSDSYLELYSAKENTDTLDFSFIRKPELGTIDVTDPEDMATTVNVPSQLEAALVYQVAGLTMVAFREDLSEKLFLMAQRYLDNTTMTAEET